MALTMTTHPEIDEIELPTDLAEAFRRVGDRADPPETLQEGFAVIEEALNEAAVDVSLDDMYQSEPTRHTVYIDETVEYVPCVMDAMIVALTLDTDPIEVHSEPPDGGEPVKFHVSDEAVAVTPETAVVSFGIAYGEAGTDLANVKAVMNEASAIPTTCSIINAFPDSAAYARWAAAISEAPVMELSLEEFVAITRDAAETHAPD